MNFNPPDPYQLQQSLYRLQDAFQRAADADTGSAKPHFQSLSDQFSKAVETISQLEAAPQDLGSMIKLAGTISSLMKNLGPATAALRQEVAQNPAAKQAMQEMDHAMKEEMQALVSQMFGNVSLDDLFGGNKPFGANDDNDHIEPEQKHEQKPKKKLNKPKPGSGDYKL
jgi:hypothetical protein